MATVTCIVMHRLYSLVTMNNTTSPNKKELSLQVTDGENSRLSTYWSVGYRYDNLFEWRKPNIPRG